jgi:hypothetical protein
MTPLKSDRIALCGGNLPEEFLKQRLLFFDRIGIFELDRTIDQWRSGGRGRIPGLVEAANELDFLRSRGFVFDAEPFLEKYTVHERIRPFLKTYADALNAEESLSRLREISDDLGVALKDAMAFVILKLEYYMRLQRKRKKEKDWVELYFLLNARRQFEARWCARCMQRIDGLEASAVLSQQPRWDYLEEMIEAPRPSTNVVDVVLDKLPMASELTPWEAIFDFKADTEAQGYLNKLKIWMRNVARRKLTATEASEELEDLLFEYKKHLKMHKLSCRRGTLGGTFVAAAEILEDLAKIKWGKAAGAVVSIFDNRLELLKAELNNPAKEISSDLLT